MKRMSYYLTAAVVVAAGAWAGIATAQYYRYGTPRPKQQVTEPRRDLLEKNGRNAIEAMGYEQLLDIPGMDLSEQSRNSLITRSAINPVGDIYLVAPTSTASPDVLTGFYGRIDMNSGYIRQIYSGSEYRINELDYDYQCGTVRDGVLYIPGFYQDMVTLNTEVWWERIDIRTGKTLGRIDWHSNMNYFLYSMTYDPVRDCFFGLNVDQNGVGGRLVRIDTKGDPSTWEISRDEYGMPTFKDVGDSQGNFMNSIAYCPADGLIYGLNGAQGILYSYNPENDQLLPVHQYDQLYEPFCFPDRFLATPLVYSPRDKAFIGTFLDNTTQSLVLFTIDADTFEATRIMDLSPTCYSCALVCYDAYAKGEAPDQVSGLKTNLDKAALSSNVTFTMPKTNFDGIAYAADKTLQYVITVDDKEAAKGNATAGQNVSVPMSFTQGSHVLKVVAMDGSETGAQTESRFYAGYDSPLAPSGLSLSDSNMLSWDEPSLAYGVNGGYIDQASVGYNIYNGSTKLNDQPVKGLSFQVPEPAQFSRYRLTVKAVNHDMESAASSQVSRAIGPGMALPLEIEPTRAQSELFNTYDANRDGKGNFNCFVFSTYGGYNSMRIENNNYYIIPNDYLYLPKIKIDDTSRQYKLTFNAQNPYNTTSTVNLVAFDVILRTRFGASDSDRVLFSFDGDPLLEAQTFNVSFSVTTPGEYYLVIHDHGDGKGTTHYRGGRFSQFKVEMLEDASTKAPGELTDVTIKSADYGDLKAIVSFTAPATDQVGNALDMTKALTVTATCGDNKATTEVLPGKKGTVTVDAPASKMQTISLYASNEFGDGIPQNFNAYIGIDTPSSPRNISHTVSEDNMTMHITWDAPTTGANGGYIDPDELTYNIYQHSGIQNIKLASTLQRSYDYTTTIERQESYFVGPSAVSSVGESQNNIFAYEILGKPHEVPMIEKFNNTGFAYTKWAQSADGEFSQVSWETALNLNGLGYGDPVIEQGCLYAYNNSHSSAVGQLLAPKFDTQGISKVKVSIKYWDCPYAADMELWARTSKDQTLKKVASCTPQRPALDKSEWKYFEFELPDDMLNCGWVQVNLRPYLSDYSSICLLDNYSVIMDIDHDFKIQGIAGQPEIIAGETAKFTVSAQNSGMEAGRTTVIAELIGDGKVIDSKRVNTPNLLPGSLYDYNVNFLIPADYTKYGKLTVRGRVESADDAIERNNAADYDISLSNSILPSVTDLNGEWAEGEETAINFTWSTPDATFGSLESFEAMPKYGTHEKLGQWKNIDLDNLEPFVLASQSGIGTPLEWEDYDQPGAWQMLDADELGFRYGERIYPHSGKSFLLARSASINENDTPLPVADWLISPEVEGGSKVTFWMNTLDSQYSETISVFYSTGSDEIPLDKGMDALKGSGNSYTCGDFKLLRHFTKSGNEAWELLSFELPADAKYFAFVYRSIGQFGAMLDDVTFTPRTPATWTIDSYKLYEIDSRNNRKLVAKDIQGNSFKLSTLEQNKKFGLVAMCRDDEGNLYESPISNIVSLVSSSVDGIGDASAFVAGGKGVIIANGLEGKTLNVYTVDGKLLKRVAVASDQFALPTDAGIYMVSVDGKAVKVLVK